MLLWQDEKIALTSKRLYTNEKIFCDYTQRYDIFGRREIERGTKDDNHKNAIFPN